MTILNEKAMDTLLRKELRRARVEKDLFLQHGLMGICIFLFELSVRTGKNKYRKWAYDALDTVCENLCTSNPLNINKGLIGVALGLLYIYKREYVGGNISAVLQNIDNHIYRAVIGKIENATIDVIRKKEEALLDLIMYVAIRLDKTEMSVSERCVWERFLYKMINCVYLSHDMSFYKEPLPASSSYKLPRFLFAMALSYKISYCRERVKHILEEAEHMLLSSVPYLGFNRLLLYASMCYLSASCRLNGRWQQQLVLLKRSIDVAQIVNEDFPDNNLFLTKGAVGLYLLSRTTGVLREGDSELIMQKMKSSILYFPKDYSVVECYDFYGIDGILGLWYATYEMMKNGKES